MKKYFAREGEVIKKVDKPVPQTLYRFFNANGDLLYIGVTANAHRRITDHRDEKEWWTEIQTITLEHFPDRDSVLKAERAAIKAELPLYNVVHNRDALIAV